MSHSYAAPGWHPAEASQRRSWRHRRGRKWEIAGIILGFVFLWPLALTYLIWKIAGYPMLNEVKTFLDRTIGGGAGPVEPFRAAASSAASWAASSRGTGNLAFEEYRKAELRRLEEERRRLDEEAQAFSSFVEELKRAKDRDEFDAFMRQRGARTGDAPATN